MALITAKKNYSGELERSEKNDFLIRKVYLPYDLDFAIYYDVHLSRNLAFSTDEVTWGEYTQLHLEDELVEKFRLTFLQKCYLTEKDTFRMK